MAFADWNTNLVNFTAGLNTSAPIADTSHLRLSNVATSARFFLTPTVASGRIKGLEQGRARMLFRASLNSTNYRYGMVFLGSSDLLASSLTNWYAAFVRGNNVDLVRGNSQNLLSGTQLSTSGYTFAASTIYAMEVDWVADNTNLGGTYVEVKIGEATDFSDLVTVLDFIDTSTSKHTSGNAEGIGGSASSATVISIDFDRVKVDPLT